MLGSHNTSTHARTHARTRTIQDTATLLLGTRGGSPTRSDCASSCCMDFTSPCTCMQVALTSMWQAATPAAGMTSPPGSGSMTMRDPGKKAPERAIPSGTGLPASPAATRLALGQRQGTTARAAAAIMSGRHEIMARRSSSRLLSLSCSTPEQCMQPEMLDIG